MNDIYQYLIEAKTLVDGVSNNKVANFAYTQTAYTEDTVDGVTEYSYGNDQNIPLGSHTDLEQNVRDKGIRSQAASLPRNAINHFFGRVSYNLNKITDTLNSFITQITRALTQNGSFYSALAEYKQYDTCTILVTEDGGNLLKTFLRTSSVPEVIQGVIPISGGVINTEHWKLMYSTDSVTQETADSSTKIASTELVDNKIEVYNSLVNAVLATKAPMNHASEDTSYGVATTSVYGHIKLANTLVNETSTAPTSAILFAVNNALNNSLNEKADLESPAFTGNPTAPTQAAGNNSTRLATTAFVTAAVAAKPTSAQVFNFAYRANNPSANQSYTLPATGVPIGGIYVFRGQLYDIDDVNEWARFLSPSGLWLQLCIGIDRYKDSQGTVNYRALGAFMDSATLRESYSLLKSGRPIRREIITTGPSQDTTVEFAEQTKIVPGGTELARTTYVANGPDSIEMHWVGIRLG